MPQNHLPEKGKKKTLLLLFINTVLAFYLYRAALSFAEATDSTFFSFLVMILYMALLLGFTLAYLVYNRFFYKKGLTKEQLPDDWSEEKKEAFLADGENRLKKSRFMLLIIVPLIITFLFDTLYLFVLEPLFT